MKGYEAIEERVKKLEQGENYDLAQMEQDIAKLSGKLERLSDEVKSLLRYAIEIDKALGATIDDFSKGRYGQPD
jgi:TolA-binding protein